MGGSRKAFSPRTESQFELGLTPTFALMPAPFVFSRRPPRAPARRVEVGEVMSNSAVTQDSPNKLHPRHWPRWVLISVLALVVLLMAVRLALPSLLKNAINRRLGEIPAYAGRVESVGVSVLRGAYNMQGLQIEKRAEGVTKPFVSVENLDFSLAWRELFRGQVVSEIVAHRARLNFTQGPTQESSQMDFDKRWQDVINDLFPIEITHFEVTEGELHFVSPERTPPVDIFLRDLHVVVRGLRNRPDVDPDTLPATILVDGKAPGDGVISMSAELEPLADQPRFHARLKIDKLSLPAVNQFLLAYANVDVSAGEFTGYMEMVARDGRYEGYFKPFLENLVFSSASDADKSIFARLWEKIVAGVTKLVKNDDTEQVALRVPFSGEFGDTSVGVWESIRTLLRNAFIQALAEGLDGHPRPKGDTEKPATAAAVPDEKKQQEEAKVEKKD